LNCEQTWSKSIICICDQNIGRRPLQHWFCLTGFFLNMSTKSPKKVLNRIYWKYKIFIVKQQENLLYETYIWYFRKVFQFTCWINPNWMVVGSKCNQNSSAGKSFSGFTQSKNHDSSVELYSVFHLDQQRRMIIFGHFWRLLKQANIFRYPE
jgi:hypothetical protein